MIFTKTIIIEMHQRLIDTSGGKPGIKDMTSLDAALSSVYQTFDGKDLNPTIVDKACRLSFALNRAHAFHDGNKRIAMHILILYLRFHDVDFRPTNQEVIQVGFAVADSTMDYSEFSTWVNQNIND